LPKLEIEMTNRTSVGAAWRQWRLRQRTREELSWLTDRELRDIGVARGDIDWLAGLARRG
jgi:uncharacterized protein YjiS (DUF1127 family)